VSGLDRSEEGLCGFSAARLEAVLEARALLLEKLFLLRWPQWGLAVVPALPCAEPRNPPRCRAALLPQQLKGSELKTLKKLGKTKCWKCML